MKNILLFLMLPISVMAQTLSPTAPIRFLALGDSYTIGESVAVNGRWPVQLRDSLAVRGIATDTLNIIATTGWRTDNLISAISNKNLGNQNYNLVSVLIGVNNQYQNRPFLQYQLEFPALLDSAIRYAGGNKNHVFVVSIPDYAYTPVGQSGNPAQISSQLDQYNAYAKHIADSIGVRYFDITPISRLGLQNTALVAGDGLHPSAVQYTEWVKLILQHVDSSQLPTGISIVNSTFVMGVYPNPATSDIEVNVTGEIPAKTGAIEIYGLDGKRYLQQALQTNTIRLSVSNLPEGVYLLKVTMGAQQVVRRFERIR
ncbi:MAG TPA: GDSL-type esterase/lipase family protein [Chitinophagales bacterium]|nr:GDSL-type esterase/lipase family protein [Chitinophagales bacterium]